VADMSLDELLSSSIKSAAEPAASAGVADAIRSRVAAGDAGTTVAGSTAPGWGGGASGILTIVAPVALIVVAGAVGGVLGVTGVIGAPAASGGELPGYLTTSSTATGYVCPGGPVSGTIPVGTRVLAVARDDKGDYLGVRNPHDLSDVMFFATGDLVLDAGGVDPTTLPVVDCPVPTVEIVPFPVVEAPPEAPPVAPPGGGTTPPPADTVAPKVDKTTVNPTFVQTCDGMGAVVKTNATDNIAVAGVTVTWSGATSGSAQMSPTGGSGWQYTLVPPTATSGGITVVVTARDAAGNTASQQTAFNTSSCPS
jgi:hypothetical protein